MVLGRTKLERVAVFASWLIVIAGLSVLAGWYFRIPVLKGQALGTFVAPNTALSFSLCGASILLQLTERRSSLLAGRVLALFITFFALATGAEYLFSIDLHIDTLLLSNRMSDWTLPLPGRYAVNTVIGFVFSGLSLLFLRRISGILAEVLASLVLLVSYLSVVAWIFGASVLYDHVMAIHTAVLFGILGTALITAKSEPKLLGTLTSPLAGAVASRKMILAVLILLPLFGLIELWVEQIGVVSMRLGTALSVIASVTVFTLLALHTAILLNETDRKRMESEAALLRSLQLAAAGRMAASIAHEVNNPLESVTNLIFLLKQDNIPDEDRKAYIEVAEKELTRVAAIARRTLGFYRDDSRQTVVDVAELVEGILDIYQNKLRDPILLKRQFCDKAEIVARAGEVRQVITNIIANAIDALNPRGGTLEIDIRRLENKVSVVIRDSGPGIGAETMERIFEPFFTTKRDTGTGLGLWISRELVVRNNGTIAVESSVNDGNHGTRFEVTFPEAQAVSANRTTTAETSV